jgi:hypothetical protein
LYFAAVNIAGQSHCILILVILTAVVMLNEGKDRLIVKRETYDDILKNEI